MAKYYDAGELDLAVQRFYLATGKNSDEFFKWIGFDSSQRYCSSNEGLMAMHVPNANTDIINKMNAALSPHWYALIKASIAREDKK